MGIEIADNLKPLKETGIPALDFCGGRAIAEGIRELLIARGQEYIRDDSLVNPKWESLEGTAKQCFGNATEAVFQHPELTYVEGYASPKSLPGFFCEHAWLVDREGTLVDPTWEDGTDYYGIPFDTNFIREATIETKTYGVLCNLWCSEFLRASLLG